MLETWPVKAFFNINEMHFLDRYYSKGQMFPTLSHNMTLCSNTVAHNGRKGVPLSFPSVFVCCEQHFLQHFSCHVFHMIPLTFSAVLCKICSSMLTRLLLRVLLLRFLLLLLYGATVLHFFQFFTPSETRNPWWVLFGKLCFSLVIVLIFVILSIIICLRLETQSSVVLSPVSQTLMLHWWWTTMPVY